jgi:hypothetical protein
MQNFIPQETIDNIKQRMDILDVINDFVHLKKVGSNWQCLCPFHDEKTPSFSVSPSKGIFKCFGCGKKGDAIKFIMEIKQCGYIDALKYLAGKYNIYLGYENTTHKNHYVKPKPKPIEIKPTSFIHPDIFKGSLQGYESNNFVQFLYDRFGVDATNKAIATYYIGTSEHQFTNPDFPRYKSEKGATVFWQIDIEGKIRTGKIMLYNATTGKRVKEPFNHINWVHKALKMPDFELKQCLFGEHLLKGNTKPIAMVESEKTAIIASIYLPQFVWVAVGSLTNLNAEKCKVLQGRKVVLYPDLNGFEKWSLKAKELSHIKKFTISDLLETKATEKEKESGLDLADYLLRFDPKDFIKNEVDASKAKELPERINHHPALSELYQTIRTSLNNSEPYITEPELQFILAHNDMADMHQPLLSFMMKIGKAFIFEDNMYYDFWNF